MPVVEKRTISLPAAQARFIDALVKGGAYASASEVVRAGLRALQERDAGRSKARAFRRAGFGGDAGAPCRAPGEDIA